MSVQDQLAAAVAEAGRLERQVEHLRATLGHPDELQSAFSRLNRLRWAIAQLTARRRAEQEKAKRECQEARYAAAAERAHAAAQVATAALMAELEG
jgi:hypothetical protein